jgi:hypothetical protein
MIRAREGASAGVLPRLATTLHRIAIEIAAARIDRGRGSREPSTR